MRVLIAPDKFKDVLPAEHVAAAVATGVRAAWPDASIDCLPLADGGEGTGAILAAAAGAAPRAADVLDPLGRARRATWWQDGTTAIIELAQASGLDLLPPTQRNPLHTSSFGTGQLLRAALEAGCRRLTLCVGGSATVDGGAGCLQALGASLRDQYGATISIPLTGGRLAAVGAINLPPRIPTELDVLCDVDNPLLGPRGAAAVFAPQKGADAAGVAMLEAGLTHWAALLHSAGGKAIADLPGAGAAGGVPAALVAAFAARILPGFSGVADRVDLPRRLRQSDVCITGEGRLDVQTIAGKVVAGVARAAAAARVPVVAVVGRAVPPPGHTLAEFAAALGLYGIVELTTAQEPLDIALAQTAQRLERQAQRYLVAAQNLRAAN